jgi:hypothetical protein
MHSNERSPKVIGWLAQWCRTATGQFRKQRYSKRSSSHHRLPAQELPHEEIILTYAEPLRERAKKIRTELANDSFEFE